MPPAASSSFACADSGRLEHRVAVELEVHAAEQAERWVVVDHQDCLAGSAPHGCGDES